jgi:hypothetical protein
VGVAPEEEAPPVEDLGLIIPCKRPTMLFAPATTPPARLPSKPPDTLSFLSVLLDGWPPILGVLLVEAGLGRDRRIRRHRGRLSSLSSSSSSSLLSYPSCLTLPP